MACYHPIEAYQGELNPAGRRPLNFRERTSRPVTVPCGQCIGCRLERARQWEQRIMDEKQLHDLCIFVTLTYDDENLPESGSLMHSHFQSFMKRLRRYHTGKVRFFMCGEYGDTTQRAHYHAILFGVDFTDKIRHTITNGDPLFISQKLDDLWQKGHCTIGAVTAQSAKYCSSYILKKVTGDLADEAYRYINLTTGEVYQRVPPYIKMSTAPGIGYNFFKQYRSDLFPRDTHVYRRRELGVPKYYSRKHFEESPEAEAPLKAARKRKAKKHMADTTELRLRDRKTVALAAQSQNLRNKL